MSDLSHYYTRLSTAINSRNPVWQAVVVETDGSTPARVGMKLAVPLEGETFGNLGGGEMEYQVINAIRKQQPKSILKLAYDLDEQGRTVPANEIKTSMICGGKVEVLIEPLFAPHPLFIIGAGHCGKALSEFAIKTDFAVTVIDNRQELLFNHDFQSKIKYVFNDYKNLEQVITFDESAFIVIMTHGHVHDHQVLEYCLKRKFRYLGMIGSQKKVAETLMKVRVNGFSEEDISRIHAPVGLPIHSHTPYEIAVSILAELIQIRNSPASNL